MREVIGLQCEPCKQKNYTTTRNKKLKQEKLQTSKFCPFCRKHTAHKETKV